MVRFPKNHTDAPCARCGQHPRHVSTIGNQYSVCIDCLRDDRKRYADNKQRKKQQGEQEQERALVPTHERPPARARPRAREDETEQPAAEPENDAGLHDAMARSLMFVESSRAAVERGELDGLNIKIQKRGVTIALSARRSDG